jgi:hypothetical protein
LDELSGDGLSKRTNSGAFLAPGDLTDCDTVLRVAQLLHGHCHGRNGRPTWAGGQWDVGRINTRTQA